MFYCHEIIIRSTEELTQPLSHGEIIVRSSQEPIQLLSRWEIIRRSTRSPLRYSTTGKSS